MLSLCGDVVVNQLSETVSSAESIFFPLPRFNSKPFSHHKNIMILREWQLKDAALPPPSPPSLFRTSVGLYVTDCAFALLLQFVGPPRNFPPPYPHGAARFRLLSWVSVAIWHPGCRPVESCSNFLSSHKLFLWAYWRFQKPCHCMKLRYCYFFLFFLYITVQKFGVSTILCFFCLFFC